MFYFKNPRDIPCTFSNHLGGIHSLPANGVFETEEDFYTRYDGINLEQISEEEYVKTLRLLQDSKKLPKPPPAEMKRYREEDMMGWSKKKLLEVASSFGVSFPVNATQKDMVWSLVRTMG